MADLKYSESQRPPADGADHVMGIGSGSEQNSIVNIGGAEGTASYMRPGSGPPKPGSEEPKKGKKPTVGFQEEVQAPFKAKFDDVDWIGEEVGGVIFGDRQPEGEVWVFPLATLGGSRGYIVNRNDWISYFSKFIETGYKADVLSSDPTMGPVLSLMN